MSHDRLASSGISTLRRARALATALLALSTLSGCIAAVAVGGAATGYTLTQERGIEDTVKDNALKAAISHEWEVYNPGMAENLNLVVYEGRVLVTGRIPNPTWRDEAIKRAWQTKGVKEVYNEIEIGPFQKPRADMDDTWISTQVRNDLVWDSDVRSVNYIVTTADHAVYLMGSARNQAELDRVAGYARVVPGVRRVVSYVQIRPGAAPGAPSVPSSASSPSGAAASPPAASGEAIEVKPLQ